MNWGLRENRLAYELDKRRWIRHEHQRSGEPPVVVLTLGKTGSTTVMETLREFVPDRPAYHVHRISDRMLRAEEREYRRTAPRWRPEHVMDAYYLRRRPPTVGRPWDVISLVRDPVARSVSAYFQTAQRLGHPIDDPLEARTRMLAWPEFRSAATWFDEEMRFVGVDVFSHPFDTAQGFQRIDASAMRLLLLRQESLDRAPEALSDFLGAPVPKLITANVAADKSYSDAYRRFCAEVKFPDVVLEEMYGSRFARHFYTVEELARFRSRWE